MLVVFGPKRLPEIGGSLGKGIRDFKQSLPHLDGHDTDQEALTPDPPEHAAVPAASDHLERFLPLVEQAIRQTERRVVHGEKVPA